MACDIMRTPRWVCCSSLPLFVCLWLFLLEMATSAYSARMCPQLCSCRNDELIAECPNAQLDMVPYTLPPRLRSLSLRGNHLRQLSGSSFSHYLELRSLDLSENQLVDLGRRVFASSRNLELLDLNKNMITGLDNSTLEGLTQLSQLDLSFNYIEYLPPGSFQGLTQLQRLDLSSNLIKALPDTDVFRGTKKLRVLSLRSNKLSSVPIDALRPVSDLALLDLGLNDISELTAETFLPLRTLEELRLDGCKLQTIQPGAFRALGSLRVLKLQDNQLGDTPSVSFSDIPRLEEIDIGQNPISHLRDRAFQHLRHLRTLGLSGATEMRELKPNAFIDNQQLEQLSLSYNVRLTQLNPATFRPLSKLRRVNLRANGLTSLPVDLLPVAWEELTELDIRDNPFVCNCSLRWLLAKRRAQHLLLIQPHILVGGSSPTTTNTPSGEISPSLFANDTTKVKCVAPSHLAGMYLDEVETEESLECSAWPYAIRVSVLRAVAGVLLVLALLSTTTCCLRSRGRVPFSLPCRRRLSPQGSSPSKQPGGSEWLHSAETEKLEYLFTQTRLPSTEQQLQPAATVAAAGQAEMANNGVYICQLSSGGGGGQRRPTGLPSQPLRFLPQQGLASPDLLDLCRSSPEPPYGSLAAANTTAVVATGYSSVPRQQPSGLTVKSTTAPRLPQTSQSGFAGRFAADREPQRTNQHTAAHGQQGPPFCYYFE
ncbi:insulin growth factor-binding protein complex acid labile subunit-like [Tropilaelaps mercedesae]|uniref:Insulin growth factor-binding protein complex acid labile subunit-like n=1 Tax=Tropilaelaps mercedesae TaxID=418985 RepID=A0A1V9XR95_9ACAR|nr:insulin growth factor-binding protein complex acid labile subunit-like [Tropilaelaps mercedesae]